MRWLIIVGLVLFELFPWGSAALPPPALRGSQRDLQDSSTTSAGTTQVPATTAVTQDEATTETATTELPDGTAAATTEFSSEGTTSSGEGAGTTGTGDVATTETATTAAGTAPNTSNAATTAATATDSPATTDAGTTSAAVTYSPATTGDATTASATTPSPTTTDVATTDAATTASATTNVETTAAATTDSPTTNVATTDSATTASPTTNVETTAAATTISPTTSISTTATETAVTTTEEPGATTTATAECNGEDIYCVGLVGSDLINVIEENIAKVKDFLDQEGSNKFESLLFVNDRRLSRKSDDNEDSEDTVKLKGEPQSDEAFEDAKEAVRGAAKDYAKALREVMEYGEDMDDDSKDEDDLLEQGQIAAEAIMKADGRASEALEKLDHALGTTRRALKSKSDKSKKSKDSKDEDEKLEEELEKLEEEIKNGEEEIEELEKEMEMPNWRDTLQQERGLLESVSALIAIESSISEAQNPEEAGDESDTNRAFLRVRERRELL